jgi:hypothetical protein
MNGAIGTDPYSTDGSLAVHGAWLNNAHSHVRGQTWRTYSSFSDMVDPSPSNLIVLACEDERSLNDGYFAFGMQKEEWIDWPSTRHNMSGAFSFADGSAEMRRWTDPRTAVGSMVTRREVPGSADYRWLRERISARIRSE